MNEIRAAWRCGLHSAGEPGLVPSDGLDWIPDTSEARNDILVMVAAGEAVCGKGTHWLEERYVYSADGHSRRCLVPGASEDLLVHPVNVPVPARTPSRR